MYFTVLGQFLHQMSEEHGIPKVKNTNKINNRLLLGTDKVSC